MADQHLAPPNAPPAPSPAHTRTGRQFGVTAGQQADAHNVDNNNVEERPHKRRTIDTGFRVVPTFLTSLVSNYPGPNPDHVNTFRAVSMSEMDIVSAVTRNAILNALYPDGDFVADNVITEPEFVLVCSFMFKSRIDHVYSSVSGRRPADRVPIPGSYVLPKAISDCINQYGVRTVFSGSLCIIPSPPDAPQDPAQRLTARVSFALLQKFALFTNAAMQRGVINVGEISRAVEGTSAWLLTARSTTDRAIVAVADTNGISIRSQFPEWTPSDGLFAGIIANGFDGNVFNSPDFLFSMPSINDVANLRTSFATNA